MKTNIKLIIVLLLQPALIFATSLKESPSNDPPRKFVVVLDAGHGGHDGGNSHKGIYEKNVALKSVLAIGKKLESQPNIKVIYTRKTDVFIPLNQRANIANKAQADLFVSVHCNSFHLERANGNETWVLGLTKSKDNLDVVMKENSVILLEDNYEENYDGFDPKDPSSYATGVLAQEIFMDDSIELAAMIQKNFKKNVRRVDRGVKQNWFVVLLKSYMPSVLVEMGFLSNNDERSYLTSEKGHQDVVNSVYEGIISYISHRDINFAELKNSQPDVVEKQVKSTTIDGKPSGTAIIKPMSANATYKVQISAGSKSINALSKNFKKLPLISKEKDGAIYRYFTGNTDSLEKASELKAQAIKKGYDTAFIVIIENGVRRRL
ncbi:N-acetylmuramoyl-L-alanine amidase family protein [Nonlabens antarcticus]|uniref:N-acetylmuramoyl-L-alanine amidase family protein n=1 Tax=Nonlabens antarcticus TaxID=392714 RepID=UPI001891CB22|nr:N-acetylmuramoyl-L-alanine amidase [Nonlabens antarcticus]